MAEYALNIIHQCQTLSPKPDETDIIEFLSDHFDEKISLEIRPSTVSNLNDLLTLLRTMESKVNIRKPYESDLYKWGANENKNKNNFGKNSANTGYNTRTSKRSYNYRAGQKKYSNDYTQNRNPNNAGFKQIRQPVPSIEYAKHTTGKRMFVYPRKDGREGVIEELPNSDEEKVSQTGVQRDEAQEKKNYPVNTGGSKTTWNSRGNNKPRKRPITEASTKGRT